MRKSALWAGGVMLTAVGGVLGSLITAVIGVRVDPNRVADSFSSGGPLTLVGALHFSDWYGYATTKVPPQKLLADRNVDEDDEATVMAVDGQADMHESRVKVTLQGNRADPVVITAIRPHVISCSDPLTGARLWGAPEGQDDTPQLQTNLDVATPSFRTVNAASEAPNYTSHTWKVGHREVVAILLTATTMKRSCHWDVQIEGTVDGKAFRQTIGSELGWWVTGSVPAKDYQALFARSFYVDSAGQQTDPPWLPVTLPYFIASLGGADSEFT